MKDKMYLPRCLHCGLVIGRKEKSKFVILDKLEKEEYPLFCVRCYEEIENVSIETIE
ncbi:MAG: hypothetical protein GY710_06240 [Desulfobacteraceae bacterium]|nr:hypothetical protein [Desulfobacteraceae bacterium]